MTETPGLYNPGYDQAEFAKRAKAASIRQALNKLQRQGVSLEEVPKS
jgi:hypothetical protein